MKNDYSTVVPVPSNEKLSFEFSKFNRIDAKKYTLYDVLADSRLDALNFSERLAIFNSLQDDVRFRQLDFYHRVSLNGCAIDRSIFDPSNGKTTRMVNFASNDYLNMSQHPSVIQAGIEALQQYGAGSGASANGSGQTKVKEELENEIATTFGYEKALTFSSGYAVNHGVLSGLLRSTDIAIVDMLCHASIMDGVGNRNKMLFKHNDMKSLENVLSRADKQYTNKIVIVDGVYSMDGDIANLPEISALCKKYNALMVDEAHAFGVIGKNGLGILDHFDMPADSIDILVGTLSKSVGCAGGFVTGNKELINYLELTSRSYLFSTGSFIASNAAALEAIRIIKQDSERRNRLWKNINYFKLQVKKSGFDIGNAQTAIFPIILGDHNKVIEITRVMGLKGVQVNGVPYPVVPRRQTRIRMTITAEMTIEHLNTGYVQLCNAIENYSVNNEASDSLSKPLDNGVEMKLEYQQNISKKRQSILRAEALKGIEKLAPSNLIQ
jgi:glycine C-acetyltransferase